MEPVVTSNFSSSSLRFHNTLSCTRAENISATAIDRSVTSSSVQDIVGRGSRALSGCEDHAVLELSALREGAGCSRSLFTDHPDEEGAGGSVQVGDYHFTEAGIVEMNKQQFNDIIQGIPEIQSILLRDMRRRGLTRKAVQKCRQRQNMRLNELDTKKRQLQEKLSETIRVEEEMTAEYHAARQNLEKVQNIIVEYLRKHPAKK